MKKSNVSSNTTRDSNIELFRIVVMLSIVAHHYVVNSGVIELMENDGVNTRSMFYWIYGMWGKTGINCFVLITGWFMCKSNITLRKFLKLFFEIVFYNLIIYIVFVATGYTNFSPIQFFYCLFPVSGLINSFVSGFMVFFLLIPFLNVLVQNLSEKQHVMLTLLAVFFYSIMGTFPWFAVNLSYASWFAVLFLIASYFRFYGAKHRFLNHICWGWLSVLAISLSVISVYAMLLMGKSDGLLPYFFVSDSNKLLSLVTSVCLFMLFKNLNLAYNKWVNLIASSTFGVFLIHTSGSAMRQWLWEDVVKVKEHYFSDTFFVYSLFVVLLLYVVCTIIDQFRIRLVEKPLYNLYRKHFTE